MKKEITLVILAAGMGTRFGGLKQIEPIGPSNEFIIDYSIYDAIEAGFNKVVFLIKEEHYKVFKETIGKRIENKIKVEYAFQKNDNMPIENEQLEKREKPLGTAHALLCCKKNINGPFAMINSDDFYGKEAYKDAIKFLKEECNHNTYGLLGYNVKNTMTINGSVKRGVCKEENNYLIDITESKVYRNKNNEIEAEALNTEKTFIVKENETVSMNFLMFDKNIFNYLEKYFIDFIKNIKDIYKEEYLIPDVLLNCLNEGIKTKIIKTSSVWYGVTYKEDKENVKKSILKLIEENKYPKNLWS